MGWGSYLLIGHHTFRRSARRAAMKAFLLTRFADIGFVLGIVALAAQTGTTRLAVIFEHFGEGAAAPTAALVLMLIGIAGKSGLIPFHDWLPDAMEGPTPASALIHGATMVAAGTVVVGRLFPLYAESTDARLVLAVLAAATTVYTAVMAFTQNDVKKLLAYSTMSQVALMLGAIAAVPAQVGPDAGLFHLLSHALFKALLFLVIGWLAVVVGSTAASAMRGSARADWVSRVALFVGLAALAGVPLFVGGVSKELVVEGAFEGAVSPSGPGVVVLVVILLTVVVTAAYSTRAFIVVTTHRPGGAPTRRTMPWSVATVLAVLTVATTLGGVLALTGAFVLPSSSWVWLAISVLLITVGVSVAWRAGLRGDPAEELAGRFIPYADRGLGVDRLYTDLVARPVLAAAAVARFLDTEVIDAYVRATAFTARLTGTGVVRAHRGERPAVGTALVALGVLVVGIVGVMTWS
jgi:NADH-quinone oxidoreductase subunit L